MLHISIRPGMRLAFAAAVSLLFCSCSAQNGSGQLAAPTESIPAESVTAGAADTSTPSPSPSPTPSPTDTPTPTPAVDYTSVKPYEVGQIMIIMYHGIISGDDTTNYYQRSIVHFKQDLQTFYDRGFRLVSMKDWFTNNITTPAGYAPLVLTFDDGKASAFSLEESDGQLQPVKDTAVDLLTQFAAEHPDFGNTAMFYINDEPEPFNGAGTLAQRFAYLLDHGYEIGNHTQTHDEMDDMNADQIQEEVGYIDKLIKDNAPGYEPYTMSYPFGIRPLEALRHYALNGTWNGDTYSYKFAVREGQSGAPSAVNRVGFDPLDVPRVRASDNEATDLGWQLDYFHDHPETMYISDGLPDRISVPEEYADNVDLSSLNGKELYIYDTSGNKVN